MPNIKPIPSGASESDIVGRIGAVTAPQAESAPEPEDRQPAATSDPELVETDPIEEEAELEEDLAASAEDTEDDAEPEETPVIDPPASWSDADKHAFSELPPETQELIAERDREVNTLLSQKSREASEESRKAQEETTRIMAERQQIEQYLVPLIQQMSEQVKTSTAHLDSMLDEESPNYDPEGYLREKVKVEREQEQVKAARQAQEQLQYRNYVAEVAMEETKLAEAVPEWKADPSKGQTEIDAIRAHAVSRGIPAELANQEYRASYLLLARDAMLYRQLMDQSPAAKKKLAAAPKMQKPGVKKVAQPKQDKRVAARRNLRRAAGTRNEADAFVKALRAR